ILPSRRDWAGYPRATYPDWLPTHWRVHGPRRAKTDPYRRHRPQVATTRRRVRISIAMRPADRRPVLWSVRDTVRWRLHQRRRQQPAADTPAISPRPFRLPTPRDVLGVRGSRPSPDAQTVALRPLSQQHRQIVLEPVLASQKTWRCVPATRVCQTSWSGTREYPRSSAR